MNFDPTVLLYVVLFAGMLLFVEGIYYLVVDWRAGSAGAINRRLRLASQGDDPKNVLRKMRREDQDAVSLVLARLLPAVERIVGQSGSNITLTRLFFVCLALFALIFAIIRIVTPLPLPLVVALAATTGFGVPLLALYLKRRRRLKRFGEQLPEALDLIVRSVLAGHPVSSSFALVAREMPDPIGSEFGVVLDEMTYGLDMHGALDNLFRRVPHPDLHFFTLAVQIQHGTGGNLAEVLSNLAKVIRDRFRMFAKIRAVSAEGRLSGVIISIMPVAVVAVVTLINPKYFGSVLNDPMFWPPIIVGIALLLVGQVIIWRLVNFKF
jgi:tight adherence protein B